ncbi:MAG: nucleoside triphosphate pyrophosphohydrolase [Sphingorhabdus sp.]
MPNSDITPLAAIMRQLRDKRTGCPWDIKQDFASIAPYTIEEAYEVADAIERDDMGDLKDELGDLLLQVVFHSQMANENGDFKLQDVIDGICEKMIRRHPHVFGDVETNNPDTVVQNWEQIKAQERTDKGADSSALAGVANAYPALLRAQKIQKRAARTGFDWPDSDGPKAKIIEEMAEFDEAKTSEHQLEEMGDLLFAVVNLSRHSGIDAEQALSAATRKFESRFRGMENIGNDKFGDMSLEEKEKLWNRVKQR